MRPPRELFRKIREKIRYGVATKVVLDRIAMMGVKIHPFYLVEERLCEELAQEIEQGFEDFEVGALGREDMETIGRIPGYRISTQQLLDRLDRGQKCFGVKHKGNLAGFTWADVQACNDKWCKFPLKDNEAYLFDAYTLEEFRGRRIAPFMRYNCYKALNQMGRNTFYSVSEAFNAPSIRFKSRLKAMHLSLWISVELFGKRHWTVKCKDYRRDKVL